MELILESEVVVAGDDAVAVVSPPDEAGPCKVTLAYTTTLRPPARRGDGNVSMGSRRTETVEVAVGEADVAAGGVLRMTLPVPAEGPPTAYDRGDSVEWFAEARMEDHRAAASLAVLSPPELHADWADGTHRKGDPVVALTKKRWFLVEETPEERPAPHPSGCFMQIEVPGSAVALGETLRGTLQVRPQQTVRARAIRVDLRYTRLEVVGHLEAGYAAWEQGPSQSTVLERDLELPAGEAAAFPFEITVPGHGPPSYVTPHNHVHWYLVGVVDRRLKTDFATHIELNVHSEPVVGDAREERLSQVFAERAEREAAEAEARGRRARDPSPPDGPAPAMEDLEGRLGRINRWATSGARKRLPAVLDEEESVYDIAYATWGGLNALLVASDRRVVLMPNSKSKPFLSMSYSDLSQATLGERTGVNSPLVLRTPSGPVELEVDGDHAPRIVEYLALRAGLPSDQVPSPSSG